MTEREILIEEKETEEKEIGIEIKLEVVINIEEDHVDIIILVPVFHPMEGIINYIIHSKIDSKSSYSYSNHHHPHSRHHKSHCRHRNKSPSKSSQKTSPVIFQIQTGFSDSPSNPTLLNPPPPHVLYPKKLPTPITPTPSNQKAIIPLFPQPPNPNLVQSLALLQQYLKQIVNYI